MTIHSAGPLYWDPVPLIPATVLDAAAQHLNPAHHHTIGSFFSGTWQERNWRNVPGPIYGAMTDNCWVGRTSAPRHILYGDDIEYEQEFLYRQPHNSVELLAVLGGVVQDPFAGWAYDGDDHWTTDLVRGWWHDRHGLHAWITRKYAEWTRPEATDDEREAANGLLDYRNYVDTDLECDLRVYAFWLDNRRSPTENEALPEL